MVRSARACARPLHSGAHDRRPPQARCSCCGRRRSGQQARTAAPTTRSSRDSCSESGCWCAPRCLLAPVVGAISRAGGLGVRRALVSATIVLGASLFVCLPWTVRNCAKTRALHARQRQRRLEPLHRKLAARSRRLGADRAHRRPRRVPHGVRRSRKRHVFRSRRRAGDPLGPRGLARARSRETRVTFDYGTAAAHYLSASNPNPRR